LPVFVLICITQSSLSSFNEGQERIYIYSVAQLAKLTYNLGEELGEASILLATSIANMLNMQADTRLGAGILRIDTPPHLTGAWATL
jgi:hypothetical protein